MQKQITTDRRKQLAAEHGVNVQYLYQCLTGRRDMNPAEAMRLETESGKELTRQMLCQKTYAGIWPGLVKANPTLDAQLTEADRAGLIERQPLCTVPMTGPCGLASQLGKAPDEPPKNF